MDRSAAMEHLSGAAAEAYQKAEERFAAAKPPTSADSGSSLRQSMQTPDEEGQSGQKRTRQEEQVRLERMVQLPQTEELNRQMEIWTRAMKELPQRRLPVAKHVEAYDNFKARIAKLKAMLPLAEERDTVHATRPDGCTCLGTGMIPHWMAVKSGEPYCPCEDGQRRRLEAKTTSRVAQDAERQERVAYLVGRINLPDFVVDESLTLETFIPDQEQEYVYGRVMDAAQGDTAQSFMLFGDASRGKSGLLATLLLRYVERYARPGKYWPATILMDEITRQSHQPIGDEGDVLWSCSRIPFLMIDDIDKLRLTTAFAVERFYQLINARYEAKLVTLVTTNMDIAELTAKMEPYVVDRLIHLCGGISGGRVLELRGENRRV